MSTDCIGTVTERGTRIPLLLEVNTIQTLILIANILALTIQLAVQWMLTFMVLTFLIILLALFQNNRVTMATLGLVPHG